MYKKLAQVINKLISPSNLNKNDIEDVIVGGHSSYQIAGRSVTKHDLDKLRKMRNYYSQIAKREARGGGIRVKGSRPCH